MGAVSLASIRVDDGDPRLRDVETLAYRGLMVQARARLAELGSEGTLRGTRVACTEAWVREHLGEQLASRRRFARAFRAQPAHPWARIFYAHVLIEERGPVEAALLLHDYRLPPGADERSGAEVEGLRCRLLAYLLDHRAAERSFERCAPELVGHARWASIRAMLLQQRERREEALECVLAALEHDPTHRVLVQHAASLLGALNRMEEALHLLEKAEPSLESGWLTMQRSAIEHELGRFDDERRSIERAESLFVLGDATIRRSLAIARAENAYRSGDVTRALAQARLTCSPYWAEIAPRIESTTGPPLRRQLDVPVLIQETMGCAPASLAMLSAFFGQAVDHVDVADQICYEGTASHSERGWVEERGWVSREFTVDFEGARALVDRGVPFLLVTVAIGSAHAQVVIGYDATRRTLIVRDPSTSRAVEMDADALFASHRAYGPRGHVVLPREHAALIDGLTLRETALHDLAHSVRLALEKHDTAAAKERVSELEALAEGHPLALWARRSIAGYEQDPYAIRACSEALLARFPDDANAEMSVLDCLETIGTAAERRERIDARLSGESPPWIFHERLARLLLDDATAHRLARRHAYRAHRAVRTRGRTVALLADLDGERGDHALALAKRRAASTLEPTDDGLAWQYFQHAHREGQGEAALEWLRDRVARFRARSTTPSQVLFQALEWLDRVDEAFQVLDAAIAERPEDANGLLHAAEAHARYRRLSLAEELLSRARARASSVAVEQSAARIAESASNLALALERHHAVLARLPLDLSSHEAVAQLTADLHGPARAREHLAAACAAHPTHVGLCQLHVMWLRGHDPDRVAPELERMLALQPLHVWAHRERALTCSDLGDHEAALAAAERAIELAPRHVQSQSVLSGVLRAAGRRHDAIAPARRALEIAPDVPGVVVDLLRLAESLDEQSELLSFTRDIVTRRSTTGTGLLEFHGYASGLVPDAELLQHAETLTKDRPELWVGPQLLSTQLLRAGDAARACAVLEAAVERFPYVTRLFLDLSEARDAAGDGERALAAATHAFQQDPSWIPAVLVAARAHRARQDPRSARQVLDRGRAHHPRSAALLREVAELSWAEGNAEQAIREVREAISFEPEDGASWATYAGYAETLDRGSDAIDYARALAEERPWNAFVWLRLADLLRGRSENLQSLDALAEALERRPGFAEALDVYVLTLARIGRKQEALDACERKVESYHARGAMRARRAWVRWEFGEREAACDEMRTVLEEHPDQLWARQTLVEWELELERAEGAVSAARELVLLAPLLSTSHGFLGAALRAAGDDAGAAEAFARGARIDPSYAYAGEQRILLALERSDVAAAKAALAEQGPHVPPATRDHWQVRIAVHEGDDAAALAAFHRIITNPTASPASAGASARAFTQRPSSTLREGLLDLAQSDDVPAEVGAYWVLVSHTHGARVRSFSIARLARRNPHTAEAAARAYFEIAGDERWSWFRLIVPLLLLGPIARRSDEVWGKVGYALAAARGWIAAQLWLRDYRDRSAVESWMLHNYRMAALNNHQPSAALRAVEHALSLPADDLLHSHLAFAAFGRAAGGDTRGARAILAGFDPHGLDEEDTFFLGAAQRLVALAEASPDARDEALAALKLHAKTREGVFSPFGTGTVQRWLSTGVLRHTWSTWFFARKWALAGVVVVLGSRAVAAGHAGAGLLVVVFVAVVTYLVLRAMA